MPHPGFLLAEDAAVKRRLSQIAVVDDRNPERLVDVFFRYPEDDTEKHYPFLTIDLIDIMHATDRQESERKYYLAGSASGMTPDQTAQYTDRFTYYPSTLTLDALEALQDGEDGFLTTESFVPVNLLYQITSYARSQSHDRQITATMLRRVTPFRRGFIEIPEDGTIRRFDLLNWTPSNVLDQEAGYKKRIFRKVYTLMMNAEIPASDLFGTKKALTVEGTLNLIHQQSAVNDNYDLVEEF